MAGEPMGGDALLTVDRDGGVATVRMHRPPVNAIAPDLLAQLADAFRELGADPEVRCIVLTSAIDRYFMAGADIKMMAGGGFGGGEGQAPTDAFTAVERTPKPVVAAIQGHALGGGCELALACDYRYMVDDGRSTIGLTETSLGLIPGGGGTQRLPRLIGRARATQMIFEAVRLRAPEALAIGLVDAAVNPDAFETVMTEKARALASLATRALGLAKLAILGGLDGTLEEGLRLEMRSFIESIGSADAAEGMSAFIQKRPASFTGR